MNKAILSSYKSQLFFRHAESVENIGLVAIQDEKYFSCNIFRNAERRINRGFQRIIMKK